VVADPHRAYVFYNAGRTLVAQELKPGLHVFSSAAEFDLHSDKADRAYALFGEVGEKLRQNGGIKLETIAALSSALGDHSLPAGSADPGDSICVHRDNSGTVSSSIVLLALTSARFQIFHCAGAPCRNAFGAGIELEVL
jgi:hypothetical protein